MLNFKRRWSVPHARFKYFTSISPGCIILSVFNLLSRLPRGQEESERMWDWEKSKQDRYKLHPVATFCGLVELKSLWVGLGIWTIFCELHCQPIIKLSFWTASLRPRMHSRESDLCPASIRDTLLTLHNDGSALHLSRFSKSPNTECVFVFVFASGSHKDTRRSVAGCPI